MGEADLIAPVHVEIQVKATEGDTMNSEELEGIYEAQKEQDLSEARAAELTEMLKVDVKRWIDKSGLEAFNPNFGATYGIETKQWYATGCATCIIGAHLLNNNTPCKDGLLLDNIDIYAFAVEQNLNSYQAKGIYYGAVQAKRYISLAPRAALVSSDVLLYAIDELGWTDSNCTREAVVRYRDSLLHRLDLLERNQYGQLADLDERTQYT